MTDQRSQAELVRQSLKRRYRKERRFRAYGIAAIAIALSAFSGIMAYAIVSNGIDKAVRFFTSYLIGSMLAKMMLGIASIFLVALKFKPFSSAYVLTYFLCYFIFTSFEVYALMRKLRPISTKGQRDSHDNDAPK